MLSQNMISGNIHQQNQGALDNSALTDHKPLSNRSLLYGSSLLLEWIMLSNHYMPAQISTKSVYQLEHLNAELAL